MLATAVTISAAIAAPTNPSDGTRMRLRAIPRATETAAFKSLNFV